MVSFSNADILIIIGFFALVILIGFIPKGKSEAVDFLLSGRNVGLFLFVLTNVATWYGGILGVGEFTYRYGLLSWFTQGFPYYIFAILFGLFFAEKIRKTSLFTIPEKIGEVYGRKTGLLSALVVFVLVLPAPYLLMLTSLFKLIFGLNFYVALSVSLLVSVIYLFKGGFRSNLLTDAFEFFFMFGGFLVMIYVLFANFGTLNFLTEHLPPRHLELTGGASPAFIAVWFLIALWTFTDPGFHQRCYAARDGKTAKYGIIISVIFWLVFDFLTTTTGLYSRAILPNLSDPVNAFPLLAEKVLGSGAKGIFYAALFATILSTLNTHVFLSGTTLGKDFFYELFPRKSDAKISLYTKYGFLIASAISVIFVLYVRSIINMWYLVGSIFIPGMIFLIIGAYYSRYRVEEQTAFWELLLGSFSAFGWFWVRDVLPAHSLLKEIEPMIAGLFVAGGIHFYGMLQSRKTKG